MRGCVVGLRSCLGQPETSEGRTSAEVAGWDGSDTLSGLAGREVTGAVTSPIEGSESAETCVDSTGELAGLVAVTTASAVEGLEIG
ncbi:hypothetical protein XM38_050030 [Halomicronema hongdechloris C2206]|uniref:Uncharacterized protein n=1 Tax=Halomicronema hongdechloris C2206 TaxID=1641165 RepID=A0A1Z3HUR3_9CYAN|nr:hypothetical protein XM38_050030 [Halomicronema hongdechloris C2206]